MRKTLQDAIHKHGQEYDQLGPQKQPGPSKYEYVAMAMAEEALDMQKILSERLDKLEKNVASLVFQQAPEQRITGNMHADLSARNQAMLADIDTGEGDGGEGDA